ncbi:hypothetical protein KI688_005367 [Linnemannia hyalina]|uniref:Protein kinase domain-containing protein n=1 Tax=Linnemannia hyalina TaxID=64524 RepID=A0A9P7XKX3_9FUNG|nr:hypothetical protein KI688_005367 [Linnemannia hyalina]
MPVNRHSGVSIAPITHYPYISIGDSSQDTGLPLQTIDSIQRSSEYLETSSQTARGSWSSLQLFSSEKSNGSQTRAAESQEMNREDSREESKERNDTPEQETRTEPEKPRPFVDKRTGEEYAVAQEGLLGEGGFGSVYKVTNRKSECFALKWYWRGVRDMDIQHEVAMLEAAGKHTHLVKYFGTVEDPRGLCLLFELCLSGSLDTLLRNRGVITEEETRYFGAEIATGLIHLHDQGMIHCDLKPDNILFASGMRVRIGDLGLAERFDSKSEDGGRVGTEGFRAPEVVDLKPHTYALDVFSFGCMIYLMLQGEEAWLTEGKKKHPKRLEKLLDMNECKLKPNAKDLVKLMLEFDPKKRLHLKNLSSHKFFTLGYFPTVLNEDVFHSVPDFITDGKRKAIPSESEQEVNTKVNAKVNTKVKLDPYCDLAILYRNTDSYEADL